MKKLIPALVLLLISAMVLVTASYAWFSMNTKVTVTGMEVKTRVSSNLLVAGRNDEAQFTKELTQVAQGILEPASTVNGETFYYTVEAYADGQVTSGSLYKAYNSSAVAENSAAYADAFSEDYKIDTTTANALYSGKDRAVPYVDYVFYLKATNTEASSQEVRMTGCNLLFNDQALSSSATIGSSSVDSLAGKAWRIGVFVTKVNEGQEPAAVGTLFSVLRLSGANYFDGTNAANGTAYGARGAVTNLDTDVVVDNNLAAGATQRYKVVVRLWLEGEDDSCTSETYAKLTEAWTLDLEFQLTKLVSAVTNISSVK